MKYISVYEKFVNKKHTLSGVALIVDNSRILLVHPRKFRGRRNNFSIPKGHVEGGDRLRSALRELLEETGIELGHMRPHTSFNYKYTKSGFAKDLQVFIYHVQKKDIQKYLKNGWEIKRSIYDRNEIYQAKFFNIDKAHSKLEPVLRKIMNKLKKKYI